MFKILTVILLLGVAHAGNVKPRLSPLDGRIIGGQNADIREYAYQVSVRQGGGHTCGGAIIDVGDPQLAGRYVVTAAHCVIPSMPQYFSVQYGETELHTADQVHFVKRIYQHELYNANTIDYDVALLQLKTPIPLSAKARAIPLASVAPAAGTPAIVTGWGATSEGGAIAKRLQRVDVDIVDKDVCGRQYQSVNIVTERMLCAGKPHGGKDACQGDSGGPLVAQHQLAGIVSWGVGCARPDFAGVYGNVAAFRTWILAKVAESKRL